MKIFLEHQAKRYQCRIDEPKSIAIELDFDGPQPNHFGAGRALRKPLKMGDFIGRTRAGGSCNVDVLHVIPHCNGTHTETISHIVSDEIWIGHLATKPIQLAALVTVSPVSGKETREAYRPSLDVADQVITATQIQDTSSRLEELKPEALIVRTLPNLPEKKARVYATDNQPPFFTVEAMSVINQLGVQHLLVDLPSVDRMYDDGRLTNHHLFWNVTEGLHELQADSHQNKTITEMVYVPEEIPDGLYGLSLQIPAFCSDAAPSRPVLFPLDELK